MVKFEVVGDELIVKEVKPMGAAAGVYLPRKWLGKKIAIIVNVE